MHDFDFDPRGFRWIDCHDADQSVLSFVRQGKSPAAQMIVLLNFTPVTRFGYRVGVPSGHLWHEVLNTDSEFYGGSNIGNSGAVLPQAIAWMGFEHSFEVTLPPLAAVFFKVSP